MMIFQAKQAINFGLQLNWAIVEVDLAMNCFKGYSQVLAVMAKLLIAKQLMELPEQKVQAVVFKCLFLQQLLMQQPHQALELCEFSSNSSLQVFGLILNEQVRNIGLDFTVIWHRLLLK